MPIVQGGDLARAVVHEPSEEWPTAIEIVAYWGGRFGPRRGRRRSVVIEADQFFGHGRYGAPMSGDQLIGVVNKLRKEGSKRDSVSKLRRDGQTAPQR